MVYPHCYRTEHSETITTNSTYGEYYSRVQSTKIEIQPILLKVLQYVDSYRSIFLNDLTEAVAIKSVSGEYKYIDEMKKMTNFIENWLTKLGIKYECFFIGNHELDGKVVEMPPVILGTLGKEPGKITLAIYGHVDVKEPDLNEWKTDPWKVTEVDKKFYGNGVALGKGPILSWFHAILALQERNIEMPVNIKFIIESMNQCGSIGLEEFLIIRRQDFLFNIDYVIVCESEWLGLKIPSVVYGSVGICHFTMTVENKKSDPKEDMEKIFQGIADEKGNIKIKDFNSFVEQITPDEEKAYESIVDFNIEEYRDKLPEHQKTWDQVKLLMSFWRLPSIWLGDIEECTCDNPDKSIVKRDFALKIVPRQIADTTVDLTLNHINSICNDLKLESTVKCECTSSSKPWCEDFSSHGFIAAARANTQIYKDHPNMVREDRDIKCVKILSRVIEKPVIVLPLGNKEINAGKANENMLVRNFYEATKVQGAYLFQIAKKKF